MSTPFLCERSKSTRTTGRANQKIPIVALNPQRSQLPIPNESLPSVVTRKALGAFPEGM
jgi:hypothetical protein